VRSGTEHDVECPRVGHQVAERGATSPPRARSGKEAPLASYEVKVGIDYPDPKSPGEEKRAEPGDVVDDLPEKSVKALVRDGVIEPAKHKGGLMKDGEQ